ncbi:MAG: LicD family protein [Clostridia bacterium]|nr:LicD family protein [Clostridia bacterium]
MSDNEPLSLNEAQDIALGILRRFDAICQNLGVQYFGMWGTLIGAARHSGFIPWDDDLDVAMKRPDYDRLLEYFAQKGEIDGLRLENPITNAACPFYISRICENSARVIHNEVNYTSGMFIDVYPLDGTGGDGDKASWYKRAKRFNRLRKQIYCSRLKGILYGSTALHRLLNIPLVLTAKLMGSRHYFKIIDAESRRFTWNESKYCNTPVWTLKPYFMETEWFSRTEHLNFNGFELPVPYKYEQVLNQVYGDYRKLPPESKRRPSHDYVAYRK